MKGRRGWKSKIGRNNTSFSASPTILANSVGNSKTKVAHKESLLLGKNDLVFTSPSQLLVEGVGSNEAVF